MLVPSRAWFPGCVVMVMFVSGLALSGQAPPGTREYAMRHRRLTGALAGMPLLEGGVRFGAQRPDGVRVVPEHLAGVEYASVLLTSTVSVFAVRGRTEAGATVYLFDHDTDGDLAEESPLVFGDEGGLRTARVPISYRDVVRGRETTRSTELIVNEAKPGKVEYHYDDLWEATLNYGGEELNVALQRNGTILFMDVNATGTYERIFYPKREILGLGSRFFRLDVDFSNETLSMRETDQKPVDAGQPAPDFEAAVWPSDGVFKLSEHRGKVVVLTFWTPLCPRGKGEAPLYHALAKSFAGNEGVRFVAVIREAAHLEAYLKDHPHAFTHVVNPALFETYGVTAAFVTFLIDGRGTIVSRQFGFSAGLEGQVRELLRPR